MKIQFNDGILRVDINDGYFVNISDDDIQVGRSVEFQKFKLLNEKGEVRVKEKAKAKDGTHRTEITFEKPPRSILYHICESDRKTVAEKLRMYRTNRDPEQYITQYDAAKSIFGMYKYSGRISAIETEKRQPITYGAAISLCSALGLDPVFKNVK